MTRIYSLFLRKYDIHKRWSEKKNIFETKIKIDLKYWAENHVFEWI